MKSILSIKVPRVIYSVGLLLILLPVLSAQVTPTVKPVNFEDIEQSVVKIVVLSGQNINSIGTGFFVGDGSQIASASHVYLDAATALVNGGSGMICAYKVFRDGHKFLMPIEYSKADFIHDVVLFKFDPATPKSQNFAIHPLTLSDSKPDIGAPIGFMGYFAGDELPILSQTTVAGYTSTAGTPELLLMDLPANPGQSGSPVFDLRTGAVDGVLTAFVPVILVPGSVPTHSGLSRSEEVVHLKRLIESADVR